MTRIVAGKYGSRKLRVPRTATRPTSERVREAVFSHLESENQVLGARVADIFAGSGALGIEALSRGAQTSVFVDSNAGAIKVLHENLRVLGATGKVVNQDALRFAQSNSLEFDLIFVDPPYALDQDFVRSVLEKLAPYLSRQGTLVLEQSRNHKLADFPPDLTVVGEKTYGDTTVIYLCRS